MAWPKPTDFIEAVQDLQASVEDEELRGGEVTRTPLGLPMLWSGNFADVFRIHCPATSNTWALKCFTREIRGLQERYRQISAHLERAQLPFIVDFRYLERGLSIRGEWFPVLKMRWVEGLTLAEFVEEHLERPANLRMFLDLWLRLGTKLRIADVTHADLQHGNVLLIPASGNSLALRLIDYDGMHVPALAGTPSGEVGHPAYQHPQRLREGTCSAEADRFPHLVIYTAIRCLMVGRSRLWQRFSNGDNLLFREGDFRNPGESQLFQALWTSLPDVAVRALVGHLALACASPLEEVPLLDDLVTDGEVLPLNSTQELAVDALLTPPVKISAEPVPQEATPSSLDPLSLLDSVLEQLPVESASPLVPVPPAKPGLAGVLLAPWRAVDRALVGLVGRDKPILRNALGIAIFAVPVLLMGSLAMVLITPTPPAVPDTVPAWPSGPIVVVVETNSDWFGLAVSDDVELIDVPASPEYLEGYKAGYTVGVQQPNSPTSHPNSERRLSGADFKYSVQCNIDKPTNDLSRVRCEFRLNFLAVSGRTSVTLRFGKGWAGFSRTMIYDAQGRQVFAHRSAGPGEQFGNWSERPVDIPLVIPVDPPPNPVITNSIGMKLVLIPAGEFLMGSRESEKDRSDGEKQHRVRITKPFYLGMYEVTQGEYEQVMGDNPSQFKGARNPVEQVSWTDSLEFCRRLSEKEGREYRLPTEAEWEYACRAGSTMPFSFGSVLNGDQANCDGNYPYGTKTKGLCSEKPVSVGSYRPNAWGLYDMHGNVWEWCEDWCEWRYYANSPVADPTGPTSGSLRVNRGGSWRDDAWLCRSALRAGISPDFRYDGFRACLVPAVREKAPTLRTGDGQQTRAELGNDTASGAELFQKQEADRPGIPIEISNSIGMKLHLIPAGEFLMGSPESEKDRESMEGPQHRVRITRPFYLGVYEVTQAEYEQVVGENPSNFKGARNPVEQASWNDAVEFCRRLSQMESRAYRLPTEAEWEYACRAGTTMPFGFGSVLNGDHANCNGTYPYGTETKGPYKENPVSVGSYRPNAWGLYDMHGNVWEWCADWHDSGYYANSPVADPTGPTSGSYRVNRGGGWRNHARNCRSAARGSNAPEIRNNFRLGFRVCLVPADAVK